MDEEEVAGLGGMMSCQLSKVSTKNAKLGL